MTNRFIQKVLRALGINRPAQPQPFTVTVPSDLKRVTITTIGAGGGGGISGRGGGAGGAPFGKSQVIVTMDRESPAGPSNPDLVLGPLRRHRIIVKWQPYLRCWEAHSDTLGEDDSPAGFGPVPAVAVADLERQLEEYEEEKTREAD